MFSAPLKSLVRTIDPVIKGMAVFSGALLLLTIVTTCYEVISRYLFNEPTDWVMDLGIYCLIWLSFGSAAYVLREGGHIAVDVFTYHLPPRTKAVWEIITGIFTLLFGVILLYLSIPWAIHAIIDNEISAGMWRIPMWPIKISVPIGIFLLVVWQLRDLIGRLHSVPAGPVAGSQAYPVIKALLFLVLVIGEIFLLTVHGPIGMVVLMVTLLLGGVPVFAALALTGVAGIYMLYGGMSGLIVLPTIAYESLDNAALVCLPAFILVGVLLERSGVGEDLFDFCAKWTGGLPGGEAIATIAACSVFAAISSSSAATAATIGAMALPALAARKYNTNFSYGLLSAGGTLGIMIPPSGPMILYSAVTQESLGKLFLAGVIPGLILSSMFIVYASLYCKHTGEYEKIPPTTWKEKFEALKRAFWGLLTPAIILGGIYTGVFTPLESGAVAVAYAIVMGLLRKRLTFGSVGGALIASLKTSTMIMCIIIGALILGNFMTQMRVPNEVLEYVNSMGLPPWGVVFAIMVIYVIMGCFLEAVSIIMITVPIVYPLVTSLGFDGIWFAVMLTLNMEMAMITPPVGMNLYVVMGLTKSPISNIVKGVIPFFFIMVVAMVIYGLFPSLSTWLPGVMIKK